MSNEFIPLYTSSVVDNMRNDRLRRICQDLGLKRSTGGRLKNDQERRDALKKVPKEVDANVFNPDSGLEADRPQKHRRSLSDPTQARPTIKRRTDEANTRRTTTRFRTGDEKMFSAAFNNQIKLEGFHLAAFRETREAGKVPLKRGGQWEYMSSVKTCLSHANGPAVVVDENDMIIFLYLPGFAKDATQRGLRSKINKLQEYQPLNWDDEKKGGDSRAGSHSLAPPRTIHQMTSNPDLGPRRSARIQTLQANKTTVISEAKEDSLNKYGLEVVVDDIRPLPEPPFLKGKELEDESEREDSEDDETSSTNMADLRGGSWHLCLAWFQLGQHRRLPPKMSVDLRVGSDNQHLLALKTNVFAWKSLVDERINNLVQWWFPTFYHAVIKCKESILANVQPSPPKQLVEKWASIYPHLALGYNRATHKHRDCGGGEISAYKT
ncbi:unnamed protein product [Rhizoctonia solani]|uniref:Uncharacterized protein n=1 Tax=Rhizoctonia solani TaxID=456999 RepID=A0A8H3HWM6_9AGAM|nr:unnamed protein product [Rhizoctonia solani]